MTDEEITTLEKLVELHEAAKAEGPTLGDHAASRLRNFIHQPATQAAMTTLVKEFREATVLAGAACDYPARIRDPFLDKQVLFQSVLFNALGILK